MSDDVFRFTEALRRQSDSLARQARGIMAERLDQAANSVRQQFIASQGPAGRGAQGSAGTIRARMSAGGKDEPVGYLLADGPGVWFWEHGYRHVPPAAAFSQAGRKALAEVGAELRKRAVNIRW